MTEKNPICDDIKAKLQQFNMSDSTFCVSDWEWGGDILDHVRKWAAVDQNRFISELQAHTQERFGQAVSMAYLFLATDPIDIAKAALATKGIKYD